MRRMMESHEIGMLRRVTFAATGAVALALCAVAICAAPAMAQDKPDYSGTWNMNAAKSDFGPVPGPTQETMVIAQKTPAITETVNFTDDQGTHNYLLEMTIDGPEVTFPPDKGPQLGMVTLQKVKAAWQGSSLVVTEALKYEADADVTGTNTYALSPDGKMLTMDMSFSTPMGAMTRKVIFDKAGAGDAMSSSASGSSSTSSTATSSSSSATSSMAMSSSAGASGSAPNLTGSWKLNVSKSDFGQIPPPDSRTQDITDNEPAIKIVANWKGGPMGDGSNTLDLDTTGKETTSQFMGTDAKSKTKWDGSKLVVDTSMTMQDADVTIHSTYALSTDGKSLTIVAHVTGPMGEFSMTSVYDKQ